MKSPLSRIFLKLKREFSDFKIAQLPKDLAVVSALVLTALVVVFSINGFNSDNPILGLRLEDRTVGKLTGDFRDQTGAIINEYENKEINVEVAGQKSTITLRQLGVDAGTKQVYSELLAVGRTGNILKRLYDQEFALLGMRNVTIDHPNFSNKLAKKYISALNKKVAKPPTNSYFAYKDQAVVLHADKPGIAIDADQSLKLLQNIDPFKQESMQLPTSQKQATATFSMLHPLLPQVQRIADKPLVIQAAKSKITLSPKQLIELIVPKIKPDPKNSGKKIATISFNEKKLNNIVDEVIKKASVAPKPTIMNGDTVVSEGKPGLQAEDTHSVERVLSALLKRQSGAASPSKANIPMVAVAPPVQQQVTYTDPTTRTGTGLVRLTFDDGPGGYTNEILDILKRYNVHATFYVVGRNVPSYAATMKRTVNEGHTIGNHSHSHANLTHLSWGGVENELASTQSAIQQACGVTPKVFRPPYGALNSTVSTVATNMGMSVEMWSVDPRDWASPGSSVITQRVLSSTGPGAVILLHVLNRQTVDALPSIIEGIRKQGYTLE